MTENRALVSVIIPAYNSERYIERCLTSLINQTYNGIEIILIDNNSEDRTVEIAEKLLKNSRRTYRITRNPIRGVSYSRNMGIRMVQGDYVFFLDSDDYLTKQHALEAAVKNAMENNLDIVHFGFNRVKENGKLLLPYTRLYRYLKKTENSKNVLKKYLSGRIWFCTGNVLYKKSLLENYSIFFTEGAFSGEDQEFIAKCLFHANRVSSIKEVFTNYVVHDSSLSRKGIELLSAVESFERLLNYLKNSLQDQAVKDISNLIVHHKIPYLILRAIYRSAKLGTSFEKIWEQVGQERYIEYLRNARLTGLSFYEVVTAVLSKFFLAFPRFSYRVLNALSERNVLMG